MKTSHKKGNDYLCIIFNCKTNCILVTHIISMRHKCLNGGFNLWQACYEFDLKSQEEHHNALIEQNNNRKRGC
jgi:hypothetical protein